MCEPPKKRSLPNNKPLFDDDIEAEEELKINTTSPSSQQFSPSPANLDFLTPYLIDAKYILEKLRNGHLLNKPKDEEFIERFIEVFESKNEQVKRNKVRSLCSESVPDICQRVRPLCWRILLGYLKEERGEWNTVEENNRNSYEENINTYLSGKNKPLDDGKHQSLASERVEFMKCQDHPLSKAKNSTWNSFFSDQALWDEIEKDTRRTRKEIPFFTLENNRNNELKYPSLSKQRKENKCEFHYEAMTRILFLFAKINNKIGYAQGMNEILAPIYFCFMSDENTMANAEADCFSCFSLLMMHVKESFLKIADSNKIGLDVRIKNFTELIKKVDGKVYEHLKKKAVSVQLFSFQWLLLLLSQEFNLEDVMRLWDGLIGHENMLAYLDCLCMGILHVLREEILKGEYSDIILLLQNVRTMDVRLVMEKARSLYNEYVA